ncbi:E3 SUMO-protein ligase PIAS2 isoform X2 [Coccinella septempunctata]|uniref:E3 SUMO-protein ligase PIAS2 isoform X2 n=1 Tax=Coccinella septempunctata TaxID=41139 RepID=UPI001D0738CC|nr:E3 SUMO-protein ligase PIAS2 isoform X2 [Coccinella septempunctata]
MSRPSRAAKAECLRKMTDTFQVEHSGVMPYSSLQHAAEMIQQREQHLARQQATQRQATKTTQQGKVFLGNTRQYGTQELPTKNKQLNRGQTIRQNGALNSAPTASSPGATELGNGNMPQQQGGVPRTTATVHPYVNNQLASRQPPIYNQTYLTQYAPQYTQRPQQGIINANYPIHPDVKFKRLPFFDVISELLKPSTLIPQTTQRMQEGNFYFHLTPQQATDIAVSRDIRPGVKIDYVKQVQMRFCLLETTCEQEDFFPPSIAVKVNNKHTQLPNPIPTNKPGVEPKRPPKPVNITSLVKLSPTVPNQISVSWAAEYGRGYAITVALVHKLTSHDLLMRLKQKGAKHSDYTRGLIKEKLNDDDSEIATTSLKVSLMCPLGKMRMTTPCRPITCSHFQCFDAHLFLQMNERKPTWICPVCDKPALYDNLVIDGYFQDVLTSNSLPSDVNEIQLHKDGSWSTQSNEKKSQKIDKTPDVDVSIEIINDDVEYVSSNVTTTSSTEPVKELKEEPKKDVVDLTLSDSDDDEPLAKRRAVNPKPDSTIKFSDTTSISSNSNQSRMTTTPGPSSVSSSGYPASPAIITLDSPSPPRSPQASSQNQQASSCMMQSTNDLEGETNNTNVNTYHQF